MITLADVEMAHELGDLREPRRFRTRGERIAALERNLVEAYRMIAQQAEALQNLGQVVFGLQQMALDDSLPGEQPVEQPRQRRVRPN